MPPVKADTDPLRPYKFHGLDLANVRDLEAVTDCPFCSKHRKFSVNIKTGQWRCFVCGEQGGILTFIEALHRASTVDNISELAEDRGVRASTLVKWGVVRSAITGNWLLPGYSYNHKGEHVFVQLYTYIENMGRRRLLPTPQSDAAMFGLHLFNDKLDEVYITEGPWDGMALWEKVHDNANVIAVPGCNVFKARWLKALKGRNVHLLFDNDHPGTNRKTGNPIPPAGYMGLQRVASVIGGAPAQLNYLHWGDEGYNAKLPSGYDVRDIITKRSDGLDFITDHLQPVPTAWCVAKASERATEIECAEWKVLINAWRKALKWTDGLDHALASMLACIISTKSVGDQLWIKVIGPASCGKSTLCEALSANKEYVVAKSTIRGFHSGYVTPGGQDSSLIPLVSGRTLVTKDGDTLLSSPNLTQILSEARDLYDSVSRTHYRNAVTKDYEGIRLTWILCGTQSLRAIDSSELGERFLDCVIMDGIDAELEDDILLRVAHKAASSVDIEADGSPDTHYSPELVEAMAHTSSYIGRLRTNAQAILNKIAFGETAKHQCISIGKFVAFMRARPSRHQTERAERELAARLVSLHVRYAKCVAAVLNKSEVDSAVMARVRRIGLDTSRGTVLDIVTMLASSPEGLQTRWLLLRLAMGQAELLKLLRFMRAIGIVALVSHEHKNMWRVTAPVLQLYNQVIGQPKLTRKEL